MIRISRLKLAACAGILLTAAGCAPQTRFEWGSYDSALYAYYKDPSERAAYEKELIKTIESGRKSGKIAPGLCAELGYIKLEGGDVAGAQRSFEEEKRLFPESRPFLSGVIQRMAPTNAKGPIS